MGCEGRDEYHDGNGDTEYSSLCTVGLCFTLRARNLYARSGRLMTSCQEISSTTNGNAASTFFRLSINPLLISRMECSSIKTEDPKRIPRESKGSRSFCIPCRTVEHLLSLVRCYGRKYLSLSLLVLTNTKSSNVPASRFSEHATLLLYFDRVRPPSRLLASLAPRCILHTSHGSRRGSRKAILVGTATYMDHGPVLVPNAGSRRKHSLSLWV